MTPQETDRIECAIRHIQTAVDVDPWAAEIAVDAMKAQLSREDTTSDLISRQDAIDVLGVFTQADALGHTPKQIVEALPSAQPERKIHFADADHVWIDGKQYISLGRFQEAVVEAQTERKTGLWIETEGLDEEIRCTMCTNPMRSDRGCDGSCQYNEKLCKRIMSIIKDRIDGGGA